MASANVTWLHLSDIHFNFKTEWRDATSRDRLLDYLRETFDADPDLRPDLIFCTGDIAFGATPKNKMESQYEQAERFFNSLLTVCGKNGHALPRERLFVVPGNHDVDRGAINADAQAAIVQKASDSSRYVDDINQRLSDRTPEFNDSMKRLAQYAAFVSEYLPHQSDLEGRCFWAKSVSINGLVVGVAGFNSAWTCSGDEDDRHIWLGASWQMNEARGLLKDAGLRVGLIHHPIDWLNASDRSVLISRVTTEFEFWLHGHEHNSWVTPGHTSITIAAGAVGAKSRDEFGFNITQVDVLANSCRTYLHSRGAGDTDWKIATIARLAPRGVWTYPLPQRLSRESSNSTCVIPVSSIVGVTLSRALASANIAFPGQPSVWVKPTLANSPETIRGPLAYTDVNYILNSEKSILISAPPQYGLTCLARFVAKEAWDHHRKLWVYIDERSIPSHRQGVLAHIDSYLESIDLKRSDVYGFVFDGLSVLRPDAVKTLRVLDKEFPDLPIICTRQVEFDDFSGLAELPRSFETLYLSSLSRSDIRSLVRDYCEARTLGEVDQVLGRLVSDLSTLNLPRTPLNCLTILKVYEIDFDESPVNRAEMIKRVLSLLFNVDAIPRYKAVPDVKDCEYILGYFCEHLYRKGADFFPRDEFLFVMQEFCRRRLIEIDVAVVFDVLVDNIIIVPVGTTFRFKFAYWFSYFLAQRMSNDSMFQEYILSDMRYVRLFEVVEFFSGIDRQRTEALRVISKDLRATIVNVQSSCGIAGMSVWKASEVQYKEMTEAVASGVKDSTLPIEVKDSYADRNYDRAKPHAQKIDGVLRDGSVHCLMSLLRSASRALRNSDYVHPDVKRELLSEILNGWNELSKVVMIIIPLLAKHGAAAIEGATFFLVGFKSLTGEQKIFSILSRVPNNIVEWYRDDLYSAKMTPLLLESAAKTEVKSIARHELILMIVMSRPAGWEKVVHNYIGELKHASFYLLDLYTAMKNEYKYAVLSKANLTALKGLIEIAAAKHVTGERLPGKKAISKLKMVDVVPDREGGS